MGVTSGLRAARRLLPLVSVVAAAGLCLAACSSTTSNSSSSSSTTSSNGSSSTTANGGGSGSSTTAPNTASQLAKFESSVQSATGGTFKLTYTETSSAKTPSSATLTFEQLGPKYLFSSGGSSAFEVIDTGTATYACSGTSGHAYCYSYASASNPFAPLLDEITGKSVLTTLHGVQASLAAKIAGVRASFSNQTFAGQPSRCVSGTYQGNSFKYCVTASGVLAYSGGSSSKGYGSITLASYSTSVSASDFALPPGATVVTLPSTSTTS